MLQHKGKSVACQSNKPGYLHRVIIAMRGGEGFDHGSRMERLWRFPTGTGLSDLATLVPVYGTFCYRLHTVHTLPKRMYHATL